MKNLILLSFLAFSLVISGCTKKEEPKNETAGNDAKKEQTSDSNKNSKNELKAGDLGIAAGLPSNFPSDLTQPKDSKCLGYLSTSEGTVVTFESTLTVKELTDFYKDEMKKQGYGMDDGGEVVMSETGAILAWKKDAKEVSVVIAKDESSGKTSLVLTYK